MNKKNIVERAYWISSIVMLFLFGMRFMGFPNKLAFLWLGATVVFGIVWFKRNVFDISVIFLGMGFLSYSYITGNDLISMVLYSGIPVLAYLAGKMWCMQKSSLCIGKNTGKVMILTLTMGTFVCGLLEKYSRFFRFTEECYSGRYWFDFWDGGIRPATYYMFYAMMTIGVVFWALYVRKKEKLLSCSYLLFIVIELAFFAWVETRTPFLVIAIVLFIAFVIFLWINRREAYVKPLVSIIGICAIAGVAIVAITWYFNLFNIQNSVIGQVLSHDGGIFGNVRFQAQRNAIMQLFMYPMGGKQMDIAGLKYVHNVWLDIAYTAGIIPFVFVAAYTIGTFVECVKLILSRDIPQEMKYLMTGIFIALHLNYSVEPVLDANMVFWAMGTCVSGMIKGYRISSKEVTYEKECTGR